MPIIETIPNVSDGRRPDVVARLVAAVGATPGVRLLDHSSDRSHNRSVLTMIGDGPALKQAILALYEAALPLIDLRSHRGDGSTWADAIGCGQQLVEGRRQTIGGDEHIAPVA